jgi:hypothetical protein
MRRKKVLGLAVLVGTPLYLKRRREAARERVHVYFDDGSTVTLTDDAPEAEQLLSLARQAL